MTAISPQPGVPTRGAKGGWLDANWVVLPAETLPGLPGTARPEERRFVLLHPARGMTILDLWSVARDRTEEAASVGLDAELRLASFLRRFDPRLPVRRIHLAQAALPQLAAVVARSHAGAPPLELPESWMGAVRSMLSAHDDPSPASAYPGGAAMSRRLMVGGTRLAACIALLAVAAVGLLAVAGRQGAEAPPGAPIAVAAADTLPAAPVTYAPRSMDRMPAGSIGTDPGINDHSRDAEAEPPPMPAAAARPPVAMPPEASVDIAAAPMLPDASSLSEAAASPAHPGMVAARSGTGTVAPDPVGRPHRIARRAMPTHYSRGGTPNARGSFIRQQSEQYATSNGG
ncbi:MAG TPA: hypothetical protein VGM87_20625 [Roseomonas sp.]|jgi:hypothetical protein